MQHNVNYKYVPVLTIAGSDSGGGAGIQADLKTFSALGCFGTSAITAVTVQNTLGVHGIHSIPPEIVQAQITSVMDDIKPGAVKIGMVHSAALAHAIAETLRNYPDIPVVFDPVMVSTSGHKLIEDDTIAVLKKTLLPLAHLVTPNLDEASLLTGGNIQSLSEMLVAADVLIAEGCKAVLLKGGHLKGPLMYDVLKTSAGKLEIFESTPVDTRNNHGTGCTLSAAVAAYQALGHDQSAAVSKGRLFVRCALEAGMDVKTGEGPGPLNHFFKPENLFKYELDRTRLAKSPARY